MATPEIIQVTKSEFPANWEIKNTIADGNPTAADNGADFQYSVGSRWINRTTKHAWFCVDNTATAVWKQATI